MYYSDEDVYETPYNEVCKLCSTNLGNLCRLCHNLPDIYEYKGPFTSLKSVKNLIYFHFIDNLLNQNYETMQVPVNGIIINPNVEGGYGDIIFAAKLYEILKRYFNTDINIVCEPHESELFQSLSKNINTFDIAGELPDNLRTPDFFIATPFVPPTGPVNIKEVYPQSNLESKFKLIVNEYNITSHETYLNYEDKSTCAYYKSSGLFYEYMGIFIDKNPWRFNTLTNQNFKRFFDKYVNNSQVFFGYAHELENSSSYINLILLFYSHGFYSRYNKNITIFSRFIPELLFSDPELSNITYIDHAKRLGYNINVISHFDDLGQPRYQYHSPENTKTLIVVNSSGISYEDMQYIIGISDKFVCITGDQSLSDAISYDKSFVYESKRHKTKLYESMITLAALIGCSNIVKLWKTLYNEAAYIEERSTVYVPEELNDPEILSKMYETIYNSGQFEKFNAFIRENFDIAPNLVGLIKRIKTYLSNPQQLESEKTYFYDLFVSHYLNPEHVDQYFSNMESVINRCINNGKVIDLDTNYSYTGYNDIDYLNPFHTENDVSSDPLYSSYLDDINMSQYAQPNHHVFRY